MTARVTKPDDRYPRLVDGRWIKSPLEHLGHFAQRADREPYVAVPVWLLVRAANFRECGAQRTFNSDEDGPIKPFTASCRREAGHDHPDHPDHVRGHSNGYYDWSAKDRS